MLRVCNAVVRVLRLLRVLGLCNAVMSVKSV